MRAAFKTILAFVCLAASAAASAGSFDDGVQPAVYFTVKFGGKRPGLKAPSLDARLDYAGVSGPELPLAFARPALLDWQMDGDGTAVSLSGLPLYARSWQATLGGEGGESRADRITKPILTGATITVVGVGLVLAAVNAFMKDLGDGLAQGMDQAMSVPDDGSGSSGSSDSGNSGSICVGTICPTGGGG